MMKKILLLAICVITLTLSVSAQATQTLPLRTPTPAPSQPPPGGIELLDGYTHVRRRGIDTRVGEITKPDGMKIRYDIGRMAGLSAGNCRSSDTCQWFKEQKINGGEVWLSLTKAGRIKASFPKDYANFYADTKSPEDIADFLLMILTFNTRRTQNVSPKE